MDNPLTYLNKLFELFAERNVSGHDQLICLHIFNKFNRSHWVDTVRISDRELQELCRLYDSTGKPISIDTIRRAKSRLKLKKLVDFKAGSGLSPTEYRNPLDTPATPPTPNPVDTPADLGLISYYRAREDVKTEDVKTKSTHKNAGASAGAGGRLMGNAESHEGRTDSCPATSGDAGANAANLVHVDAYADAKPLDSPKNDTDIFEVWHIATNHAPLGGYQRYELNDMAEEDYELTVKAIKRAMDTKSTFVLKFDYVKQVYHDLKNPKEKGSEKNGKTRANTNDSGKEEKGRQYEEPDTSWVYSLTGKQGED